jgi:amino acid transporter
MNRRAYKPGRATLLAMGTGTSIASVCLLGIVMIRSMAPGLWALAALAAAFALCRLLAGVFGHLVTIVPSGAGMFAFVSRAWSPSAGMVVIAPYVMLMVLLGALEALIVGHLLARWLPAAPLAIALGFLVISWAVCAAGMRLGFRFQAVATALLVAGMAIGSAWILAGTAPPVLASHLVVAPPSPAAFASAVGQAVFLFMGFELVCTQVESSDCERVRWTLKATVWVLLGAYGIVLLAASVIDPLPGGAGLITLAPDQGVATAGLVALCLLASATSLNGAFTGLARLVAVMGSQRVLPAAFAAVHAPTLVPRAALGALLLACLMCAVAIEAFHAHQAVILAAAISAAALYALAFVIRRLPPFQPAGARMPLAWRVIAGAAFALLVAIAGGVLLDAGEQLGAVTGLLIVTYGAGALVALRLRFHFQARRPA